MAIEIEVEVSGPIADGTAEAVMADFLEDAKDTVAQQAYANVMTFLNASIRNPTPYYETQIIVQSAGADRIVHDRGVIYGPWLEGVGSRNSPVTRFPGYHSFRRAAQQTESQAGQLLEHTLQPYLRRLQ